MAQQEMVEAALRQLDVIFASAGTPHPASSALVESRVFDWAKDPHVKGAYSYPSRGAEEGDREALAAPVDGTLFFAGEATHEAVNPCMQAAMETGLRAAGRILAAERPVASKL
mmetsp:Transcript_29995/g.84637  ORF Transcript_29995/g.84637 Transcript_29995/m.84637 type:complete len:113 (+) Transcript_29995:285-623(+)